jgi:hypothetical protein
MAANIIQYIGRQWEYYFTLKLFLLDFGGQNGMQWGGMKEPKGISKGCDSNGSLENGW